ncbi:Ubiquitin-conjugating enzyme 15 [Striga hermonthica]|uniref:Ubiquitin-conjugating enzyme 15 n=1 Tax=Striga hermonthica TaxID=68872 RepID=A0A9N7NMX4_STRHE|nr:Ubiquitin-conjugating enzyme 15 [Striga hermonthica]
MQQRPADNDRYVKNCKNGRSPKETRWWFHDDKAIKPYIGPRHRDSEILTSGEILQSRLSLLNHTVRIANSGPDIGISKAAKDALEIGMKLWRELELAGKNNSNLVFGNKRNILYDSWSPAMTVSSICISILSMLSSSPVKQQPADNDRYVKNCKNGRSPKETRWWFHDDKV